MDSESTKKLKTKKIKLYPNKAQRQLLRQWFGTSRYIYNYALSKYEEKTKMFKIEQENTYNMKLEDKYDENKHLDIYDNIKKNKNIKKSKKIKDNEIRKLSKVMSYFYFRDIILKELPNWSKDVPHDVKAEAINDLYKAKKNAKLKYGKTKIISNIRYRSKRETQSIYIPSASVKNNSIYKRVLCKKNIIKEMNIKSSEPFDKADHRCRMSYDKYGHYSICIPVKDDTKTFENQERLGIVALDPGVRTFQTYYNEYVHGEWGKSDHSRLFRLCLHIDKICSRMSKAKSKVKRRLKKAKLRMHLKIKNLVKELHHKLSNFLCKTFDIVLLPTFNSQHMSKKLKHKTSRSLLTWSHYKFKEMLKNKGERYKTIIVDVNESYTSVTCGHCGYQNPKFSSKTLNCKKCKIQVDRDLNGARNILLRALRGTSLL
jgi:putative transposase